MTNANPSEINRVYTDEFISIYLVSNKPKTKVYSVWTKDLMCKLGGISWYPAWRHYCFFPNAAEEDLVFSDMCLLNIGNQVLALNKLHTKKLNRENNQTFLIVTHNTEVADACKKKILLRDGRNA